MELQISARTVLKLEINMNVGSSTNSKPKPNIRCGANWLTEVKGQPGARESDSARCQTDTARQHRGNDDSKWFLGSLNRDPFQLFSFAIDPAVLIDGALLLEYVNMVCC
jgi:hypothetical protein